MVQLLDPLKATVLNSSVPTYTFQVMYFMGIRIVLNGKVTGRYRKADDFVARESGSVMWTIPANPLLDLPIWGISGIRKEAYFNFGKMVLGIQLRLSSKKYRKAFLQKRGNR